MAFNCDSDYRDMLHHLPKKIVIPLSLVILFLIFIQFLETIESGEFVTNVTKIQKKSFLITYEVVKYPSSLEVVARNNLSLGFVTDPWNLNFGKVTRGGNITRRISINNSEERDVLIRLKGRGNISKLLNFERDKFILKGGTNISIGITAVTKDVEEGTYTGEIDVIVKKPNFDFIYFLWNIFYH